MLFPLPLTAFENYMLADDSQAQPMSFYLRLCFFGTLDRAAFSLAIQKAVGRHPLFRALVRDVNGRAAWVRSGTVRPRIVWDNENETDAAPAYIDLAKEVGLRIFVEHVDEQARVLFQCHHACTDGIGAVRFIEDVLAFYTAEVADAPPARMAPLDPALLRGRGKHGLNFLGRLIRLPLDLLASLGVAQFFCHRPTALETPRKLPAKSASSDRPAFVSRRLSHEFLTGLREASKRENATINDILVRDLHLAIDAWNARHHAAARGRCVRVSVPVNLRQKADARLPATNVVSMVFVDRRVQPATKPRRLLKSIHRDTSFIKLFRLALVFTWVLEVLHQVRGGFKWLLGANECLSTAVLSNLGVQFDDLPLAYLGDRVIVGDALLDSINFLPPIRKGTNASLGVVTYAGELMISLQYAPQALPPILADDLLRLFELQIAKSAGREERPMPVQHAASPAAVLS